MGIILLPIIALVLARGHQYCETLRGRRAVVVALGVIVTAVLINGVQRWLFSEQLSDPYWNTWWFAHLHGRESRFLTFTWIAEALPRRCGPSEGHGRSYGEGL